MNSKFPITEITAEWFERQVARAPRPVLWVVGDQGRLTSEKLLQLLAAWKPDAAGCLDIVLVNAAAAPEFARSCGVLLASGLMLFHQGVVCYQFVGEVSRPELEEVLLRASRCTPAEAATTPAKVARPFPATGVLP
jgi:hypothetical protein